MSLKIVAYEVVFNFITLESRTANTHNWEVYILPKTLTFWFGVQWGDMPLKSVGDAVKIKIPYGEDFLLHRPALPPIFCYLVF